MNVRAAFRCCRRLGSGTVQNSQAVGFNKKASVQLMAESMREFSNAFSVDTGFYVRIMVKHIPCQSMT